MDLTEMTSENTSERWRFPRFFTEHIGDDFIEIIGDDAKHIRSVLRMKNGEKAVICDGNGTDYLCEVYEITQSCLFKILDKKPNEAEPSVNIRLFQALPKSDKLDFIVQKATELGVSEIIPFMSKRCVSRPDDKSMAKKIRRFNKIALEAAKQSGRGKIPYIHDVKSYKEAVGMKSDLGLFFYEIGGEKLNNLSDKIHATQSIDIMIGCEGGFEPFEAELAEMNGWHTATLGKRILRCETAPIVAVAMLMNMTDNL